ncbi:MAG: AraC family ligand binding domain-containing protein [Caldicoprobacterales bacterium]
MFVRNVEYYPYHWHDTLEIVVVLKGSINLIIGDESLLLHKNDIALVNIDEMHRMDNCMVKAMKSCPSI